MTNSMRLWDDNPTVTDLLGIDTVVDAVAAALLARDLDPVTVALQSPWGGGKSSALDMLAERFEANDRVLVVRVDPWEFEDSDDVRATLIGHLLTELRAQRPASFTEKVGDLLTRIAWKRVGATIAKSAITMSANPLDIIKAFTPDAKEQPTNMAGFRDEFDKMIDAAKDIDKVVVLVDDLDRCKPASVVASLEAIKVFLAVPKMAFVLAAEEDMIRWAIAQDIHAGGRSEFADRYLEKIVQLPVSLPRLTPETTEDFVTLLLCQKHCEATDTQPAFEELVAHVAERRRKREYPLIHDDDYPEAAHRPDAADRRMANLVARGLSGDQWSSPRAIKRFLNAWGVREAIANAREVTIKPDLSLKLYLLEQRFPEDFEALQQVDPNDRTMFVSAWEAWGREEEAAEKPDQVSETTRFWAGSEPSIAAAMDQFDRYVNLAASFTSFSAGSGLTDAELSILAELTHQSDGTRIGAVAHVLDVEPTVRRTIVERLFSRLVTIDNPSDSIESACRITLGDSSLVADVCGWLRRYGLTRIEVIDVFEIAQVPGAEVDKLLHDIANDQQVTSGVRAAAQEKLDERTGAGA
ncbi:P-loop NTPase fold protein [Nocardioides sp. Root151]|uniref:KAP family P-loop NTPase fold protein n=1 Tax=Nocardioides sp. Root151 TaxID=1736475 RepID=UPI00138F292B|nr:P-loop NTPase fold protein [Nocardioides sp. Root151]